MDEEDLQASPKSLRARGKLRKGDRWGHLECIGLEEVWIEAKPGGGVTYQTRTPLKELRCTGGGQSCQGDFLMFDDPRLRDPLWSDVIIEFGSWEGPTPFIFPGKGSMRHCGCLGEVPLLLIGHRYETTVGKNGRPSDYPHWLAVSVPRTVYDRIKRIAEINYCAQSNVYRDCLNAGLDLYKRDNTGLGRYLKPENDRVLTSFKISNIMKYNLMNAVHIHGGVAKATMALALMTMGLDEMEEKKSKQWLESKFGGEK